MIPRIHMALLGLICGFLCVSALTIILPSLVAYLMALATLPVLSFLATYYLNKNYALLQNKNAPIAMKLPNKDLDRKSIKRRTELKDKKPKHFRTFHPMQLKMSAFLTTFIGAFSLVKGSFAVTGIDGYAFTDVASMQNYDKVNMATYLKFSVFLIIWAAALYF